MTKEFKYNPDDKIPPKRRMKAVAEAVAFTVKGDPGPASTAPCMRMPVALVAVPAFALDVDQEEAQQKLGQARAQADLEKSETLKSEGSCATSSASHAPEVTAELADMEILTANRVTLGTAHSSVNAVYGRNTLARRNLLRTDNASLGDDSSDDDDGPAACFLKSDAQRRFEENKRLTVLSEHTEPSSSGRGDDVGDSIPGFRIEQPNLTALNIVEPGVWMGQSALRKGPQSTFSEPPSPLEDDVGQAGPSRMAESFFLADISKAQPQFEDVSPIESNDLVAPDAVDRSRNPSAVVVSPERQIRPLPATPTPAVVRAGSSIPVHLSPIREVDSSRGLWPEQSDASPAAPLQTKNEKPPSTAASSPGSSFDAGCVSKWCSIVWNILAWVVPLAFLAGALHSLATTRTFHEIPPDLFTAESRTIHSEKGSGNLTMAWMNGHAIGFNVPAVLNTTVGAGEAEPKSWTFLFNWRAEGEILSADAGAANGTKSAVPLPSFGQDLLRSMGFFGLFAAVFWLVRSFLSAVSRCWHWREDDGLFWTRTLLHQFDRGRLWAELTLSAVVSAAVWAAASRALLAMPV